MFLSVYEPAYPLPMMPLLMFAHAWKDKKTRIGSATVHHGAQDTTIHTPNRHVMKTDTC